MSATQTRLSKDDRRQQLLDCAAQVVIEHGTGSLTMEGLAVAAGVSKALPYSHFENADTVLVALYEREVLDLGRAVIRAVRTEPRGDDQIRAAVGAYLDFVRARGAVLGALTTSISRVADSLDPAAGPSFVGTLLTRNYDLDARTAERLGELIIGCLTATTAMWSRRAGSRRSIEATVVDFILAGIHDAVGQPAPAR